MLLLFCFCLPTIMWAQPQNDECENAIALTNSVDVAFSTIDATSGEPYHPADCTGGAADSLYNDTWYTWTATFTGEAEFTTCGTADFDTNVAVYAPGSSCPPDVSDLLACNEDGTGCDGFTSTAVFDAVMGETYLLRIGGWGNSSPGEEGTGTFSVIEYVPAVGPENQECVNAIVLELDANDSTFVEYTTIDANTTPPTYEETFDCFDVPNGETTTFNEVWYTFTAPFTGFMEWSNCGTANYDSRVAIYGPDQPCPPDPFALVGCSDDGVDENGINCGNFTSRTIFPVENGSTYLIDVGGFNASSAGSGTFILRRTEPPVPPANDNCETPDSAWVISQEMADNFDVIHEGFTLNATQQVVANPACRPSGEFWDVWYKFNSGNNTDLTLRFNNVTPNSEFIIDLYYDCSTQAPINMDGFCVRTDEFLTSFLETTIEGFPGTPTEYLIRVSTRITSDQPGEFWFQMIGEPLSSVDELALDNFRLFPNPAQDQLNIDFDLPEASKAEIEIINTLGQRVQQSSAYNLMSGNNRFNFDISNLQAGIYFFRIHTKEGQKTAKFIKE